MENQQKLANYISQQLSQGKTPNEISAELIAANWPEAEVSQAFSFYQTQVIPTQMQSPTVQAAHTQPLAAGQRKGRIRTGFRLLRHCLSLLNGNRYLLRYFLMTWVVVIGVNAVILAIILLTDDNFFDSNFRYYTLVFLNYLFVYCVINFYAVALARNILDIYKGERKTYREYVAAARVRFMPIFVYSLISSVIGTILQYVFERAGWLGRIIYWLIGTAWSIGTMFTLPIIMDSEVGGITAIKQSWGLFKQTWGEGITAKATAGLPIAILQILLWFAFIPLFMMGLASGGLALLLIILCIYLFLAISLAVIGSYASNFISAALYYYAVKHQVPPGFSEEMLNSIFIKSKRQLKKEAKTAQ